MSATPVISPGTYLRKRRQAAGLGVMQAASLMAASPWAIRHVKPGELPAVAQRLTAAEEDRMPFKLGQAEVLRSVFAFDLAIYNALLARLPLPMALCRVCACSQEDACFDPRTGLGCAWVHGEPDLCTTCAQAIDQGRVCGRCDRRAGDPAVRACTDCACPLTGRVSESLAA